MTIMIGHTRLPALALAAALAAGLAAAQAARPVALPQDHPYQVALRDYLATLTEADFALELKPLAFGEAWVEEDEALHRLWIATRSLPTTQGLTLAPDNFLLSSIESAEGVRTAAPRGRGRVSITPTHSWWAEGYRATPYAARAPCGNPAFVVAAARHDHARLAAHMRQPGSPTPGVGFSRHPAAGARVPRCPRRLPPPSRRLRGGRLSCRASQQNGAPRASATTWT